MDEAPVVAHAERHSHDIAVVLYSPTALADERNGIHGTARDALDGFRHPFAYQPEPA
jgi:hypothetical protein